MEAYKDEYVIKIELEQDNNEQNFDNEQEAKDKIIQIMKMKDPLAKNTIFGVAGVKKKSCI
ncbi:hypothetical protein C1645_834555 [Glomus cerebriforme]|uniref:Uncharacterized protein n=1 Tax=Glomus cerebriforme TaxID=658196 RepID=A0A397SE00_9GLOM|nr:hypothetical protein C1645_834555 [Glomus cerebriforme]